MPYVIPANCQVRLGLRTITFRREMHGDDRLRAEDVVELDGKRPTRGDYISPGMVAELQAMIAGKHPTEM